MQTPTLKISGNIEIVRERTLPVVGEVLVAVGDEVKEEEVVLRASLKSEIVNIRTREVLSLGDEEISKYFKITEGQKVKEGDILFRRPGLFGYFSEELKSTANGIVEFVDSKSGFIGIRPEPRVFEVRAYLRGKVQELKEGKSIKIKSGGSGLLQGVYGRGRECSGVLSYVESLSDLSAENSGKIIALSSHIGKDELVKIAKNGARGLIVSSVCSSIVSMDFEAYGLPPNFVFMVVDGFGLIKPSDKLIRFLEKAIDKDCSLSGQVQIRAGAIRPELIVHEADLGKVMETEAQEEELKEGSEVRVVRGSHIGEVGILQSFTSTQVEFPSGIRSLGVEVLIGNSTKIYPLQNIETV